MTTRPHPIIFLTLIYLTSSQPYLSKDPGYIPINDLHSKDVARLGKDTFWKVDQNGWSIVLSSHPVRPGVITIVTILMEIGQYFIIGCGMKDVQQLKQNDICQMTNSVQYDTFLGTKCKSNDHTYYGRRAYQGDKITMTIDLRPYENHVSFAINGESLGIAYGGLNEWGQNVYIMLGVHFVNHRFKIIDYRVLG